MGNHLSVSCTPACGIASPEHRPRPPNTRAITRQSPARPRGPALRSSPDWPLVALANKNARILRAMMTRGEAFDGNHLSVKPAGV